MEIHDMGEPNLQADLWSRRPEHDGRIRDMPYIYVYIILYLSMSK